MQLENYFLERKNFSYCIALSSGKSCSSQLIWNNSIELKNLSLNL